MSRLVESTMLPATVRRLARLQVPAAPAAVARGGAGRPRAGNRAGNGGKDPTAGPANNGEPTVPAQLERAWPRHPGHLLLDYVLADGTHVAGQWFADSSRVGGRNRSALEALARATAATTGATGAVSVLADRGVVLQAAGADRRLPGLATLAARDGARLVAHRPERRGVVRLVEPVRWVKVVRSDRGLRQARPPAPPGVATARLLGAAPASGTTTWSNVEGRTLHDLLGDERESTRRRMGVARAVGAAVRRLHDAAPVGLESHDPVDELAVVANWGQRLAEHLGHDPTASWVPRLRTALADTEQGSVGIVHRDLHDKQVLVSDVDRVGLIDFDTVAAGEGVLDLANLLVHLELRARQQRTSWATANTVAAALLDGYGFEGRQTERLRAYAATTRVRLSAVYAFRPRWAHLCEPIMDEAFSLPPGLVGSAGPAPRRRPPG